MHDNVLYDLIFESNPELINLSESSIRGYERVLFIDSLFDFFPRVEVFFKDVNGVIPDQSYFLEDLEFTIKLGNKVDGYLGGQYVWAKNEFNDTQINDFFSGTNAGIFVSKYIDYNGNRNKSWQDSITNVINNIITSDYAITDATKKFLSNTTGTDYWYQSNQPLSEFIQILANYALDISQEKSPYYAFINSNSEVYFMHLYDLFTQKVVNSKYSYTLTLNEDANLSKFAINDYIIQNPGMEINIDKYQTKVYETTSTGISTSEIVNFSDFIYKDKASKLLLRSAYNKVKNIVYKGIKETIQDKYNYTGLINSLYRDSALSYRMYITIPFNPNVVSGKVIDVKINSAFENKVVLNEYSGKWLCLKTLHHIDGDGLAYSNILIGKSSIDAYSSHKFYSDFQ